jgi:hypothetical protein
MDLLRTSTTDYGVEISLTYGRITRKSTGGTVDYGLHTVTHCISTLVHEPTYVLYACNKS